MKKSSPIFQNPLTLAALAGLLVSSAHGAVPDKISFNQDVRPILSDKCFSCHGLDQKHRKADLRLDTPEGAYAVNEDKIQAIKPGDLEHSELWRLINSKDEEEVMPPIKSHKTLSDEEKSILKRWIEQGAVYQKHWAFEAPVKAELPVLKTEGWAKNEVDRFIGARLERDGLTPAAEADKSTLIRRASFALTGLPPTPQDLDAFLADPAPDAYEKIVDRYLASPRFGEEMARHWLDVARYADTHGLHLDNERQMWAYRDWVIKAFNTNQHFDQFTIEQLAGDLIPNATKEQLTATGFNRCNVTTSEGGAIDEEYLFIYAVDRASTMTETWMGLTAGCAVCHDHKYDPLSTKEFYSLYSFFRSNADPAMDGNKTLARPTIKLSTPEQDKKLADMDVKIAELQKQLDEKSTGVTYVDPATVLPPPAAVDVEEVWIEDDFPAGAKMQTHPGNPPLAWITAADGPVFSGKRAIKRADQGFAQDFYSEGATAKEIPKDGKLYFHVFIDPTAPPAAVMLQIHAGDWEHRAVWGNAEVFVSGAINTPTRLPIGPLPEANKWVRLEVEAAKINLKQGDKISGIALSLHGGTAYFDKMGVTGKVDPPTDPNRSFLVWQRQMEGKDTHGATGDLAKLIKEGPNKARSQRDETRVRNFYLQTVQTETKGQFAELNLAFNNSYKERTDYDNAIPSTFVYNDLDKPKDTFVMIRGAYDKPGEKVVPDTPAILPALHKANPERASRMDLARWLVAPEHPLTSRVTTNRFWQQFLGTGLVKTSFDFGSQGEPPTHPELLDWMSVQFRESGWDVKALVRLMVTSATFRQKSVAAKELWQRDPENRLYARGPRFRLDAEQVRDNALFVSGLINLEMGGRGVRPYQPPNIWEPVGFQFSDTRRYKQDTGPALYRRSVYSFIKRTAPPPFMSNFDAPNRESFCTRRERSNTPLQALHLMNDEQHFEAARGLAERILTDGGSTPAERIAYAYRIILARPAGPEELAIVQETLTKNLTRFQAKPEDAAKAIRVGESTPKAGLPEPELAAYTLVANLILNLDETVTRN